MEHSKFDLEFLNVLVKISAANTDIVTICIDINIHCRYVNDGDNFSGKILLKLSYLPFNHCIISQIYLQLSIPHYEKCYQRKTP